MRATRCLWNTYKEIPKDAEVISHQLLLRAGLLNKSASGIFDYLPLFQRSIRKLTQIIIEEMEKINCFELQMSTITPSELWQESGRWDLMGPLMLKIQDRHEKYYCFSPTNEEAVVNIFRKLAKSYKALPVAFHQVNTKFRDEIRPRFGLLRGREFLMHDAYSFHLNKEQLDQGYHEFYRAYENIFNRVGLKYLIVEADGGAIASSESKTHEFQVLAASGEDTLVYCEETRWAANIEKSVTYRSKKSGNPEVLKLEKINTPTVSTMTDLEKFFKCGQEMFLKALFYKIVSTDKEAKNIYALVFLAGDDELNEIKLKNALNAQDIVMGTSAEAKELGIHPGYLGPLNIQSREDFVILVDENLILEHSYICGANETNYHYLGFCFQRDMKTPFTKIDLRLSKEGDFTQEKTHTVKITKGIEVGHIFQLGDKYSQKLSATVLDVQGKPFVPLMGTYGIGVTRTLASAIEQSHDANGIVWPLAIAPFHVHLCGIFKSPAFEQQIDAIYEEMQKASLEVFYDDRFLSPGVTFKDADILGLPFRILVSEKEFSVSGLVELKFRNKEEILKVSLKEAMAKIIEEMKRE